MNKRLTGRDVWLAGPPEDAPALGTDDAEPDTDADAAPDEDADTAPDEDTEPDAAAELDEGEALTAADELVVPTLALLLPCTALPIVPRFVQSEEDGAGCAGGVTGSPWWNVDVPYTPIGYVRVSTLRQKSGEGLTSPVSALQFSKTPAS